jgi:uncharacterized protein (TIGR02099 family)
MLPRLFKGLYHFTVYAIGILVLTAAVVVTLIRLFLPDIGIYRGEIEAWVSNYMGYPVVIHSLDATWEGWVPHLQLSDIDLLNKAGTQAITHFDSAQIKIAPLATLVKRRIMPKQLTINGFELAIARLSNGAIYIEGINVSDAQISQLGDNELAEWLFKQEQIKIENARIEWLDIKHQQQPILLTDVSLTLRSDGERLQAEGSTTLPELYGKNMDFAFDAHGDLLSSDWSGELYLAGHDINPEHWYKSYRPLNFNVSGGNADIKVWSTWQKAKLSRLEGELQYYDFDTRAGDSELHVQELAYRFLGKRLDKDGWQFHLNLNHLLTDNGDWPETNIMISATRADEEKDYRYSATFNYLKLDDFSPFIRNLTFLPDTVKDRLTDLSVNGELSQGKLIYDPEKGPAQRFRFDTQFMDLDTDFGPELPSLMNLSGHLYGYLNQGVVSLNANNTRLKLNVLENRTLQLSRLEGEVIWHKNQDEWKLGTNILHIRTDDLSARLTGSLAKINDNSSPFIDIAVTLDESDLEIIPDYLPYTSRFKLRDWMRRSVLGGKLSSASAIFRGYISDFPFDTNNGRFKLIADTTNATLDYSAFWPPVDNIDAEIDIDGRALQARFRHGEIFAADVTSGSATIADILNKNKTVVLGGHIRGSTKDLSLFIDQSPLQKDRGLNEISHSLLDGDISMDLDLNIPIKQPGKKVDVAGDMHLSNSTLKSPIKNLQLDNVEGNISFTRYSVNSETLNATFSNKPVSLLISGSKLDANNPPSINVMGSFDEKFVTDRLIEYFPGLKSLEHYFRDRVSGETEWRLRLTNVVDEKENKVVKKLEVESNLSGLALDFPAPVGKPHYRPRPIKVSSYLGYDRPQNVQIEYADVFDAALLIDTDKKLHTINLHFGEGQAPANKGVGLHISGTTDELAAIEWWDVIKPRDTDKNKPANSVIQAGVSVEIQVASLELFNRHFTDVALSILRPAQHWNFDLQGDDIRGAIQIPLDRKDNNIISFQLDKLALRQDQQKTGTNSENRLHPQDIPAIQGRVDEFMYNEMALGEMYLQTSPVSNGLSIEQLSFDKPALNISGSGDWISISSNDSSSLNIELHADDMETMLTTFGYEQTPVKKGETELQLKAEWQGSPMDFSLEHMNGTLGMQISKGQMLDINPSAGRLFGLFSLQTLSRRLSLDFSDIFGKGLAFDRIEGSFDIDNGNAYTNDLFMRGPSADVAISGRTGLLEQDYDQIVTVTPQFSDNIPVAGVLLGPVGIGLGAVFYLAGQMFDSVHDSIDKLLRYQYTITGSWDQPVVEKIKKQGKNKQAIEPTG